jgi:4-aminobutyrate aminotransferase-like enzyme
MKKIILFLIILTLISIPVFANLQLDVDVNTFRKIMLNAENHELLLLTTGLKSTIRLLPPFTISTIEMDIFVNKLKGLLDDVIIEDVIII